MSKKLKNILRNAEKGATLRGDIWEAYIDLPKHGGSIAVCSTNKDEAVKIRQIILSALHAPGEEEDPDAWRERNRQRQAAGVRFEWNYGSAILPIWGLKNLPFDFTASKEMYREVPQEVSGIEYARAAMEHLAKTYLADKGTAPLNPLIPHAAERALWKAQREAGTNEVWIGTDPEGVTHTHAEHIEPFWLPDWTYRPKPKPAKLTASIVRNFLPLKPYKIHYAQDWEFYGTPEEYRAECEKYGYVVISEIKEVVEKPKTVTHYFALVVGRQQNSENKVFTVCGLNKEQLKNSLVGCSVIGDIEEREVEV